MITRFNKIKNERRTEIDRRNIDIIYDWNPLKKLA